IPFRLPFRSSAARLGIAKLNPGGCTISTPPIDGRADGPCWDSHKFCSTRAANLLNGRGLRAPPGDVDDVEPRQAHEQRPVERPPGGPLDDPRIRVDLDVGDADCGAG